MPNIFIILGEGDTRKSSTIRALTGVAQRRIYQIALAHGGDIGVFVQIVALQEKGISPKKFVNEVTQKKRTNVLVSLRVKKTKRHPDGNVYIQNFLRVGWNIQEIVVLGLGREQLDYNLPEGLPVLRFIPASREMPANRIASQVRKWWQWL